MRDFSKLLWLCIALTLSTALANASDTIAIKPTSKAPLFDGRCGQDEWQGATKLELSAGVSVYLMRDADSLFVCARGKAEDYTVIDLYIENSATGKLYNLHASAQLTERIFKNETWSDAGFWNQKDWSGFWVPYAGSEDTEDGPRTKFLKGSHREIQVLRKKFPTDSWKLMIGISAVQQDGSFGPDIFFPESAVDTDPSTWAAIAFSD